MAKTKPYAVVENRGRWYVVHTPTGETVRAAHDERDARDYARASNKYADDTEQATRG